MNPQEMIRDIIPLAQLPAVAPHLGDEHRFRHWLRRRGENGAEAAGALWVRDGIAYARLSKLAEWLVAPQNLRKPRKVRK